MHSPLSFNTVSSPNMMKTKQILSPGAVKALKVTATALLVIAALAVICATPIDFTIGFKGAAQSANSFFSNLQVWQGVTYLALPIAVGVAATGLVAHSTRNRSKEELRTLPISYLNTPTPPKVDPTPLPFDDHFGSMYDPNPQSLPRTSSITSFEELRNSHTPPDEVRDLMPAQTEFLINVHAAILAAHSLQSVPHSSGQIQTGWEYESDDEDGVLDMGPLRQMTQISHQSSLSSPLTRAPEPVYQRPQTSLTSLESDSGLVIGLREALRIHLQLEPERVFGLREAFPTQPVETSSTTSFFTTNKVIIMSGAAAAAALLWWGGAKTGDLMDAAKETATTTVSTVPQVAQTALTTPSTVTSFLEFAMISGIFPMAPYS